jgi:hypothetical protein
VGPKKRTIAKSWWLVGPIVFPLFEPSEIFWSWDFLECSPDHLVSGLGVRCLVLPLRHLARRSPAEECVADQSREGDGADNEVIMSDKSLRVSVRVDPEVLRQLEQTAQKERRTISNLTRNILSDWTRGNGWAADPGGASPMPSNGEAAA